jgi:hypothetical protein
MDKYMPFGKWVEYFQQQVMQLQMQLDIYEKHLPKISS